MMYATTSQAHASLLLRGAKPVPRRKVGTWFEASHHVAGSYMVKPAFSGRLSQPTVSQSQGAMGDAFRVQKSCGALIFAPGMTLGLLCRRV